jgi:hypothetical protein
MNKLCRLLSQTGSLEFKGEIVLVRYIFTDVDTIKYLAPDGEIYTTHYKSLIVKN